MSSDVIKAVEDFFNRDNEAEGVEHYTQFDHISERLRQTIIEILKL